MQAIEQGDTSADNELIGVPTTGVRTYGHLAVLDGGPLAMREVAREVAYRPVRPLGWMTPSMRLAFLWMALRPWEWVSVPSLMEATGMTRATAKRAMAALRELLPMGVRVSGPTARTYEHRVEDPVAFVTAGAIPFGAAVVGRVRTDADEARSLPLAGRSALAQLTGITAPETEVRACSRKRGRELMKLGVRGDDESPMLEVLVLSYDPMPLVADGMVDPATLALTCAGTPGAPVGLLIAAALEEALKETPWLLPLV